LIFIAKIKNGFTPALRPEIAQNFRGLKTTRCPFANLPELPSARRGEAITAKVRKNIQWLKPTLVAQIEFTERTKGNHLRHSRFIRLRDDKEAAEVTRRNDRASPAVSQRRRRPHLDSGFPCRITAQGSFTSQNFSNVQLNMPLLKHRKF
jgi:ATP-dependent DNA ligase